MLIAFFAGALAAFGHAPVSFPFATLVGLAIALFLHLRAGRAHVFWISGAFGFGYFALSLHWIVEPFLVDPWRHGWMAPFAILFLAAGMALFWALAAWLASRLAATGWAAITAWVLCLSIAEMARTYVLTGFPWALIGHIWIGWPVMHLAALVGALGLTLFTLIIPALFVGFWERNKAGVVVPAVILGAAFSLGSAQTDTPVQTGPQVTVRLIQPNAPQHLKWHPDHVLEFFERALEFTAAVADQRPDLIIWPETSVPSLLHNADVAFERITKAANGASVVLGIQRRDGARQFNSLVHLSPYGTVSGIYDKHHLVPFGEYVPAGDFAARFGVRAFAAQQGYGYSPGPGAQVIDLGMAGKALPLICYEAVFPQDVNAAPERPDFLLQITNDAWFGDWAGPRQHLAQARLRAIEQGLPMVRAANTGISAVITAQGEVTSSVALNTSGFVDVPLPRPAKPTLYSRTGDWPFLVLFGLAFLALLFRRKQFPIDGKPTED